MALLVLDTATEVLAAGLSEALSDRLLDDLPNGSVQTRDEPTLPQAVPSLLLTSTSRVPRGHSVLLQPLIDGMFKSAGMEPANLSGIAVGIGPGSYTGVRLGVSTAKAMAYALNIPLYPISTLFAMAASASFAVTDTSERVVSLLYARRKRAFGAVFEKHGDMWTRLTQDKVQPVSAWIEEYRLIQDTKGLCPTTVVHDFRPQYDLDADLADFSSNSIVTLAQCGGMMPQGLAMAWAAGHSTPATGDDIHLVEPGYALPVEAEAKLKEAKVHGGKKG